MRNKSNKEIGFENCLADVRKAVSQQNTIESALRQAVIKTADMEKVYDLVKPDLNCCDPVLGGLQNSLTGILNQRHPVGGLSVHIDTDTRPAAIRITQHPSAGSFEETIYLCE